MNITIRPKNNNPKLIWIDTNVVVMIKNALKSNDRTARGYKLFTSLIEQVRSGKVICPITYQRDEYTEYYDEFEKDFCDKILVSLSRGNKITIVKSDIFRIQFERMLKVFKDFGNEFWLEGKDILLQPENDENAYLQPVILISGREPNHSEITNNLFKDLDRRRKEVADLCLSYDQIRKSELSARKISFNMSIQEASLYLYKNINSDISIGHVFSLSKCKEELLGSWIKVFGQQEDPIVSVNRFFDSEYYEHIPYENIYSRLVTNILLSRYEPIKSDIQDLENISIILPYADYIVTDKVMKGYLYQEGLGDKYHTKIYDIGDAEKLIEDLEKL